ncbi:MAG: PGF-pre-PGF domain-containing protein [Halodesulfurarchaeum sp.]
MPASAGVNGTATPTERANSPESGGPPNATGGGEPGPPKWADPPIGSATNPFDGTPGAPGGANRTSRTVRAGGRNVTVSVVRGPPEETPGSRTWARVQNATPNASIPIELPEQAKNASVGTERLSIAVTDRDDFTLSVTTASRRPSNQTPEFTPPAAAEGLGYISVAHTVPDEEIKNVTFRFSVGIDTVEPDEREDVALYRYHNGSWNELPTRFVTRNGTEYIFEGRAPGLSSFTVGKKVASFEIQDGTLLASTQTVFDPVNVRVRITNEGGADGVYTARLLLNGREVASERLSIAAGGTRQTSFRESVTEAGQYTVLVNNYTIGTLNVTGAPTQSAATSPGTTIGRQSTHGAETAEQTPVTMPGFGPLIGLFGGWIAIWLGRRR